MKIRNLWFAGALLATSMVAIAYMATPPDNARAAGPIQEETVLGLRTSQPSVQVLTTQGPGTVTSAQLTTAGAAMTCVYNQTANSGSSSVTWGIQFKDPSSTTWITELSSSAITTNTTSVLSIGRGVATASNAGLGISLPYGVRTYVTESGGGSTVTGTVGCDFSSG